MDEKKDILSTEEVWDVMKFASSLKNSSIWQGGVYTPDTLHQLLVEINNNPINPSNKNLKQALSDPNNNERVLQGYSEWYNTNDMTYKKANNYLANMLSFDLRVPECINASTNDYKSEEYKKDLDTVYKFLDNLNYKREFKKITKNLLRQGTIYGMLRTDSDKGYAFQQLPSSYCKSTGYINSTLLFDFDFGYFLNPTTDIRLFPKKFMDYYIDIYKNKGMDKYIPSNPINKRDGSFVFYRQLSPLDGAFAFMFDTSMFANIPYLAPVMTDAQNVGILRQLQMNKNIASAQAILMGEIGFLKESSGGVKTDQINVSPDALAMFLTLVKNGLNEIWKAAGLPLEDIEKFQYEDNNPKMYSDQLKSLAAQTVSMSRAIYADDKLSQMEAEISLYTDANMMKSLYIQFEDFLNLYVNMHTKKFKFKFHFEGINYPVDKETRFDMAMQSASVGIVLPSLFQTALGLEPQEFEREMERAKHTGFSDKLSQLISIHTQTSGEKNNGRPKLKRTVKGRGDYDTE